MVLRCPANEVLDFEQKKLVSLSITRFNQFEINKGDLCSVWKVEKAQLTHQVSI